MDLLVGGYLVPLSVTGPSAPGSGGGPGASPSRRRASKAPLPYDAAIKPRPPLVGKVGCPHSHLLF